MEKIKKNFEETFENVIIFNYNYDILWFKNNDMPKTFEPKSIVNKLKYEKILNKNKEIIFNHNDTEYLGKIIEYPDSKLYAMLIFKHDVMSMLSQSDIAYAVFENQAAKIRNSVSSILTAANILMELKTGKSTVKCKDYLDITTANCYRLLQSVFYTSELMKYRNEINEPEIIELNSFFKGFTETCNKILQSGWKLTLNTDSEIYIKVNQDRFISCMLSLIVFTGKKNTNCKNIILDVEKTGEFVSVTASSIAGKKSKSGKNLLSPFVEYYKSDNVDSTYLVIDKFCRSYNATFLTVESESDKKVYSIKLPLYDGSNICPPLNSPYEKYAENMFSNFHVALSILNEYN